MPKTPQETLRVAAIAMDKHIETKHRSANNMLSLPPTRKRTQDGEGIRHDARRMEETQSIMLKLADMHEAGTIPAGVSSITSRAAIERERWGSHKTFFESLAVAREETGLEKLAKLERAAMLQRIPGFFPTPQPVVDQMMRWAELEPWHRVLEPSAGTGRIADSIRAAGIEPGICEISYTLQQILGVKNYPLLCGDFLDLPNTNGGWDRILMNPPFENNQDVDHVTRAYDLLKPGGRLVAIVGAGAFYRTGRKEMAFRELLRSTGISEALEEGAFKSSGTMVNSRIVTMRSPA